LAAQSEAIYFKNVTSNASGGSIYAFYNGALELLYSGKPLPSVDEDMCAQSIGACRALSSLFPFVGYDVPVRHKTQYLFNLRFLPSRFKPYCAYEIYY
jgi:hypothetical protein